MTLHCPKCESREVRRSMRRGLFEWLFKLALVLPYRCEDCNTRFFKFGFPAKLMGPRIR